LSPDATLAPDSKLTRREGGGEERKEKKKKKEAALPLIEALYSKTTPAPGGRAIVGTRKKRGRRKELCPLFIRRLSVPMQMAAERYGRKRKGGERKTKKCSVSSSLLGTGLEVRTEKGQETKGRRKRGKP